MESYTVHFRFSQHFDFPAKAAFEWCTDYDARDIERMGGHGRRRVERVNDDTFILTDAYEGEKPGASKRKLVRLYPETLSWTNTRISAGGMYSQFLYTIVPEAGGSRLDFTGSQLFAGRKPGTSRLAEAARRLAAEDGASWRRLAEAMSKELSTR